MNASRVNELMAGMKSFSKERYRKCELLQEMLKLQQEMVELTLDGEQVPTADLRIWDVERYLTEWNEECGNAADEELKEFINDSKVFCNLIKAEISGIRGENKVFRYLQYINTKNLVLKNVELSDGRSKTELDAVVITPSGLTIIEVKNTAKNIFIDENGNYFRTGEFLRWDCNISDKMEVKETLLRKALENAGISGIKVQKILVFTDNRIEVQNKASAIRTCFVSLLPYIIDGFKTALGICEEDMYRIEGAIQKAESKSEYSIGFDVKKYKTEFADVMAILEEASVKEAETLQDKEEIINTTQEQRTKSRWAAVKEFFRPVNLGHFGSSAAAAAITLATTVAVNAIRKEWF